MTYKKEYVEAFLEKQGQLFDEPVAQTLEEADEFLDECMAYVASEMDENELLSQAEVFAMPDGKYLIVEG